MPLTQSEMVMYGSALMPDDDTPTAIGGAIDTSRRVVFTQIEPAGIVEAVSSDAGDTTQTLTVTGLDDTGVLVSEALALNGTTVVAGVQTFERIYKAVLSGSAVGTVTLREPAADTLITFAPGELEVRQVLYGAAADVAGGAARTYYEKVFIKNNGTTALTSAQISELADPAGVLAFALEGSLDGTDTNGTGNNRQVAPTGYTFDSAAKPVANSQSHSAGAAQGIWIQLTLAAGAAGAKTGYSLRESGITT